MLERLRGALDEWLAGRVDRGGEPEEQMIAAMWPGGEEPVTGQPVVTSFESDGALRVRIDATTPGASLGYRVGGGRWRLYAGAFPVRAGSRIEAKAVRYGWAESPVVSARAVAQARP